MSRKTLLVVVTVAAVIATNLVGVSDSEGFWGGGFPHNGGKTRINWEVSGTIAFVQLAFTSPEGAPLNQPGILVDGVARGAPGDAQFKAVGIPGEMTFAPTPQECGNHFKIAYERNDFVATFEDQSMFFATIVEGYACIFNPAASSEPLPPAVFQMTITDGTGRFSNATGQLTGTFWAVPVGPPVNPPGPLLAETGTINGWIDR